MMILTANLLDADLVPDGDLDKDAWSRAERVSFRSDAFKGTAHPEIETTVASLWTSQHLYLAYWCKFVALNFFEGEDASEKRWELWTRDVVEAFIAPQPNVSSHYYEFEVAPNNQWIDLEIDLGSKQSANAQWNSGFKHATQIDAARRMWTTEMRIPARSLGVEHIDQGTEWRINLYRADGFGPDAERNLLSWSPLPLASGSFHQPASFGVLRFSEPGK